ncbi:MAG: TRAP transporter large permease [Spirochaetaceae bacterium]|nr:TRAP transporter large permease [Spirochaetaceae bacterium]
MLLTIIFLIMLVGFALGIPVAFTLGIAALSYFVASPNLPIVNIPLRFVTGMESYELMAIPLYMLAGNIMNSTGVTDKIFRFTRALVGHFTGGTAHVNILASLIFSGMSGSALADASGLGKVLIRAMTEEGYDKEFSAAVTGASATIGPVFPPSIPMVLIGGVAGISIGKLFIGGVVPGLLLTVYMMVLVYFLSKKRNYPKAPRASFPELRKVFIEALPALTTPVLILGGILLGFFTPTEAGVIAVVYALFVGMVIYRESKLADIFEMFITTAKDTANIMIIVGAAYALAWVFSREQVGALLSTVITGFSTNPTVVLVLIVIGFLLAGCFMNPSANIIIFIPMLMPLVNSVGIDLVHFGVIATLTLMIGLVTPPLGLSMFIICEIAHINTFQFIRGMKWFFLSLLAVVITMLFVPETVTWLPKLLLG